MPNEEVRNFPVTVYGNLEKYSDVISKGRCRIFYKGANRNRTFITDEFADKLISSLPYVPVKGIYDAENKDFTDHGEARTDGKIYGVVPAEPNFAWEKHVDEDGIEREYACVDVLYYTGLYSEASIISGKSQSMEIYSKTMKGAWKKIEGKDYYVFTDGCFLGLQALGDNTEPCFEGAAFYSLFQSMKEFIDSIENYNRNFQNDGQGGKTMDNELLFKLSDAQKENKLWELLNSELDENGYRMYKYSIMDVYDEYALAYNYETKEYERVYYTKSEDAVELGEKKKCYIIDVTEPEFNALTALRTLNGDTYEKVDETFTSNTELKATNEALNASNEELNTTIASLNTEKETMTAQLNEMTENYTHAQESIATLTTERDSLASYKKNIEDNEKLAVIDSYADAVSEEVITSFKESLDKYTCEELDMKLTYEQKKAHPDMFNNKNTFSYVPKDEPKSGVEAILARYEKK